MRSRGVTTIRPSPRPARSPTSGVPTSSTPPCRAQSRLERADVRSASIQPVSGDHSAAAGRDVRLAAPHELAVALDAVEPAAVRARDAISVSSASPSSGLRDDRACRSGRAARRADSAERVQPLAALDAEPRLQRIRPDGRGRRESRRCCGWTSPARPRVPLDARRRHGRARRARAPRRGRRRRRRSRQSRPNSSGDRDRPTEVSVLSFWADVEETRADHGHHRPGRLVSGRTAARKGLRGLRPDPPALGRPTTGGSSTCSTG